jgi:FMN hydrolase / 5-amino-6-(5-phospho-D-ribitylamino)uracil phosphatase
MKKPVKAVLFDLDDTLWPIAPVISRAEALLHDWMAQHAPKVPQQFSIEQLRAHRIALMATEPRYQFDLWALRHASLQTAFSHVGENTAMVDAAMAVFAKARNTVTLFDDVLPGLQRLHGRVTLGSISNGFADLEAIGIAHHFKVSLAAHRFGCAKPAAEIFHAACSALEITPDEAVYVGDDLLLDVDGAQKAGLRGVWLNRTGLPPQQTLPAHIRPDAIFTSLHELEDWLFQ